MSLNESYPQHVVTAVIVAHDGAAWLPHVADAVLGQTRPVQRVVAVDTGSRDRSGAVLAAKFGQAVVFGMDRATGYGAAIARALQHRAANVPVPGSGMSSQDRIEWLWLLHDDCEPALDALEQLLRGAAETNAAAVLGPKIRDWANREVILEAGVTVDTAARRVTGIEPREVDQGQHDGDRDALAVSSAGMLVRRDVWDQVGGFDTAMGLFMEDIDFCWRVHAAGYRVRVITDSVVFHVQAATRHRRSVSVGRRARMLDRRNGLLTLLGNLPFRQMLTSAAGNAVVSLLRITFFLIAKRLVAALDEAAALAAALGHPLRLMGMRRRRSRGRRAAYSRIRADLPPGRSLRRLVEFAASTVLKSAQTDTAGAHHASADPTEDDSLLVDNIGLIRRLLTSPAVLTSIALVAVAAAAGHLLIGPGPLGGGALVPAWGGATDLWRTYLQAFHASGIGSTMPAPPYLAVIAGLATLLGGKPWLAIDVILLGCVPLAGMSAMFAARRVTKLGLVRVWAGASYALLPVAMGVVAAGRFGTAVVFVLLPVIALLAGRIFVSPRKQARRAAWATGLLVMIGATFVPLLWLVALLACVLAALAWRNTRPGLLGNLAIVALTAPVLLLPWTLTLVSHPAALLLEAGLQRPGTATAGLSARSLMLLSPGGPGLPPFWVTAGLVLAALAALLAGRRRRLIMTGWGIAMSGLLLAIVVSRLTVVPAAGGPPVAVWAGLPLAIAAVGLLLAATVGADALARMLVGRRGWRALAGGRSAWAALIALTACSAPLVAAAWWVSAGVSGPVRPATTQLVPELVAMADGQSRQVRTLVLRVVGGHVSYLLLRGPSPSLADAALSPPADAQRALAAAVAALIAPGGGSAVMQSQLLADFDIGFVLVQMPVDPQLVGVLNNVSGLRPYSTTSRYDLWQLDTPPARVTVVEPNGTVVPISSGPVGVSGAQVPAAGGTLMLAEPIGGWSAALNGHSLIQIASPAGSWAQAFRLPAGGGTLDIGNSGLGHDLALAFQALALIVIVGLALPGIHTVEPEGQHAGAGQDLGRRAGAGRSTGAGRGAGTGRGAGAGRDLAAAEVGAGHADDAAHADDDAGHVGRLAGRAGPGHSLRGAGRDRAGQAKSGRGRTGRGKARRGKAGLAQAGLAKAASPPLHRGRPSVATGRSAVPTAPVGQRGTRLPDAWPYAAGDDLDEQRSVAQDGFPSGPWPHRDGEDRDTGERSGAWPYGADDDPGEQRSVPRAGVPSGPRPHRDGEDRDTGERSGAWPDRDTGDQLGIDQRAGLPGRSPSGRMPSGGWPYPAADDELSADRRASLPARSPSGWVPPVGRLSRDDDDLGLADRSAGPSTPAGTRPYADERGHGWAGRAQGDGQDQPLAGSPADRSARPQRAGRRFGAGRGGRAAGPERAQPRSTDSGRERPGRVPAGGDRDRGRPAVGDLTGGWDSDRATAARADRPARRHGGDPSGSWDSDRSGRRDGDQLDRRDGDRLDRWDSDRSDRRDGDRLDRWDSDRSDRRDGDQLDRWDSDRSDRRDDDRLDRRDADDGRIPRGREDSSGRWAGSAQAAGRRGAEPLAGWPGGGGDALEPLPPLAGPGTGARGRSTWRPDAGSAESQWDDAGSGGSRHSGRRPSDADRGRRFSRGRGRGEPEQAAEAAQDWDRSSQVPEHRWPAPEPEPEYEGDTW